MIYHCTELHLAAVGRGRYSVPEFYVTAAGPDEAISLASRIVLCDRRATDGIRWTFSGEIRDASGERLSTFADRTEQGE